MRYAVKSGRLQVVAAAGKSTKTDYGQDWYKSQKSQKDSTIREDLSRSLFQPTQPYKAEKSNMKVNYLTQQKVGIVAEASGVPLNMMDLASDSENMILLYRI